MSHQHVKKKKKPESTMFLTMGNKDDADNKEDEQAASSSDDDEQVGAKIEVRTEKMEVSDTERLQDIEERDQFAERLRTRDDEHTKRKMDSQSAKVMEEAAKRLRLEKEDRKKVVPKLRVESRQVYLKTREEQKLAELELEIKDEQAMFGDEEALTDAERLRLEQKKQTLRIAKQYKEADQLEKADRYYMPSSDKKDNKQHADKYAEDIKEKGANFEQRKWEEERTSSALMQFGSRDAKERHEAAQKSKYEYLLEDEITFVKSLQIPGKNDRSGKHSVEVDQEVAAAASAKKSLADTRKSLPIYQYRDELLEAIRHNQIIVIEGETGSGKTTQSISTQLHYSYYKAPKSRLYFEQSLLSI